MKRLLPAAVVAVLLPIAAQAANLTDNGNGTVTDSRTALTWQQSDDGVQRTWEEAIAYCEGLSFAGRDDWRLPNYKALQSLVDNSRRNPATSPLFVGVKTDSDYWSSTTAFGDNPQYPVAFSVWFDKGQGGQSYKTNPYSYTRCVTGGQPPSFLAFGAASYAVREKDGTVTIGVARTGSAEGAVSVAYATGGGTATADDDYTPVAGTLSWASGDMSDKTFTVAVKTDGLVEGEETVNLTLSNPAGGGAALGTNRTAVLSIQDSAVAALDPWENVYSAAPNTKTATDLLVANFAAAAGSDRLLLVAVCLGRQSLNLTPASIGATYGGQGLSQLAVTSGPGKEHMWIGYLSEAQLGAAVGQELRLSYSFTDNNVSSLHVKKACYAGVNQANPFRSSAIDMSMLTTFYFPKAITFQPGDLTAVVFGNNTTGDTVSVLSGSPPAAAWPTFTAGPVIQSNNQLSTTFSTATHATSGSYGTDTYLMWSDINKTVREAMAVFTLQP